MSEYQELIAEHHALQKLLADQPQALEMERVLGLIAQVRDTGVYIGNPWRREQLRAILRYWGAFVYERTGEFPPTQLAPYEPRDVVSQAMVWLGSRESQWGLLRLLPWGLLGLFVFAVAWVLIITLPSRCYRPAPPDVTATPAAGAEGAPSEQDQRATAAAESTRTAEMAEVTTMPAEPPPTAMPTPTATAALPTPVTSTPTPTSTPLPPGQVTHIVQRGENLFRIALRYGTTVQAIASANGIANPARIYVGQTLIISTSGCQPPQPPAGMTTYVVQPGENLFRIALRYNLSYMYLAHYNGIANPSCIYAGQVLRIPPY
jgi:LysM repeat protein